MNTIYNIEVDNKVLEQNLHRLCNQVFKLLPMREEGKDYLKPLDTLLVETTGLANLIPDQPKWLAIVCKLQGLKEGDKVDFLLFRRTIFEVCGLINDSIYSLCPSQH